MLKLNRFMYELPFNDEKESKISFHILSFILSCQLSHPFGIISVLDCAKMFLALERLTPSTRLITIDWVSVVELRIWFEWKANLSCMIYQYTRKPRRRNLFDRANYLSLFDYYCYCYLWFQFSYRLPMAFLFIFDLFFVHSLIYMSMMNNTE